MTLSFSSVSSDYSKLWGPRTQLMQICMISILLGNNKNVTKTEYLLFHCTCYVSDVVWSPFLGITSFSHSNNYVRKLLSLSSRWRKSLQRKKKNKTKQHFFRVFCWAKIWTMVCEVTLPTFSAHVIFASLEKSSISAFYICYFPEHINMRLMWIREQQSNLPYLFQLPYKSLCSDNGNKSHSAFSKCFL